MDEEKTSTELKNTVTIEDAGPCKKKVSIEIPAQAIKNSTDEQYQTLRKEAAVPGFRKGRAPRRLLEKRFGKETNEQTKLKLMADASDSAIKDNKLNVLREPDVDIEKFELPESGPLKFDFEVEVRPEFDLPKLEEIPVKKTKLEVTDEQLEQEIDKLRKWAGIWVERGEKETVQADDQIIADAVLKVEGLDEEEKLNNIEIHIRPYGFVGAVAVEKLDELLIGCKAGDERKTTVKVPKTYFKEELRDKKVDIQITVRDIKCLKPAELNEDFFSRVGAENETQLRELMTDTLQGQLETQSREEMTEQIYKYMLDSTDFDLPTDIAADQAHTLLQRQYANMLRQGIAPEQMEERMDQLRAGSEQQAKQQLKTFFIMDKVAEKLEIDITDEEVNGQIAQLAIQRRQRPEKLREDMVRNDTLAQFKLQLREAKCIEKLLESAKITEIKPKKKTKKTSKKTDKKVASTDKKPAKKRKTAVKKQKKE